MEFGLYSIWHPPIRLESGEKQLANEPNFKCPECDHESYQLAAFDPNVMVITCPNCKKYYDEEDVECWAQTIWPYTIKQEAQHNLDDAKALYEFAYKKGLDEGVKSKLPPEKE
jgi:transcription initiation factor IIE alpha subunit